MPNLLRRGMSSLTTAVMSCIGFVCLEIILIAALACPWFWSLVLLAIWLEAMVVTDGGR